jgi:hypothetical protein
MNNEGEKPINKVTEPQIEALASLGVKPSVEITVDTVRELVHNLARANCNGLQITPDLSRKEIAKRLQLYGFPLSILHQEVSSSSRVGSMLQSSIDRIKGVCSLPLYDADLLRQHNQDWQMREEESMRVQTVKMHNAGEMVFVEEDGKLVGMIGIRKLGPVGEGGRELYEFPRFSILSGDDEKREAKILLKLMKKVQESILKECANPLILVHTKRPSVRKWALRREHRAITCEDYFSKRNISPSAAAELKERWEKEGWEYFEVDPLKKIATE